MRWEVEEAAEACARLEVDIVDSDYTSHPMKTYHTAEAAPEQVPLLIQRVGESEDRLPTPRAAELVDHHMYRDAVEVEPLRTQSLHIQEAVVEVAHQRMSPRTVQEALGRSQTKLLTGTARLVTVYRMAAADAPTAVDHPSRDEEELAIVVVEDQACVEGSYTDTAGCMGSSRKERLQWIRGMRVILFQWQALATSKIRVSSVAS